MANTTPLTFSSIASIAVAAALVCASVVTLSSPVGASDRSRCPPNSDTLVEDSLFSKNYDHAEEIISLGCTSPQYRSSDGATLLATAALLGKIEIVDALLQQGHHVDDKWVPPIVQALLGHILHVSNKEKSPLHYDHIEIIVYLINSGAPVDIDTDGSGNPNFLPSLWTILCKHPGRLEQLRLIEPSWVRTRSAHTIKKSAFLHLLETHRPRHDRNCTLEFFERFSSVIK